MDPVDRPPGIVRWTLRLEDATVLDRPVRALEPKVRALFGTGTRGSVLRGEWLGHAVHPLLTDVVLGTWTSATVLDLVGGPDSSTAARRLIGTGLLAVGPTAWTGWAEWSGQASATSASASSTRRPTGSRSVSTRRPGSPGCGAGTEPGYDGRWPERRCPPSRPTWAATSPRRARWPATILPTTPPRGPDRSGSAAGARTSPGAGAVTLAVTTKGCT